MLLYNLLLKIIKDKGGFVVPVYEYKCIKCEEIKETLLLNNEKPPKYCKKCGGKLKKLISNSTFKLKGGGWFADGYSKKRGKPPKKN